MNNPIGNKKLSAKIASKLNKDRKTKIKRERERERERDTHTKIKN